MPGMYEVSGPLVFGLLVALAILIGFVAIWRIARTRDSSDDRLQRYALREEPSARESSEEGKRQGSRLSLTQRLLAGFGLGPRIAMALTRADIPLTAAEFSLIVLGAASAGFIVGTMRGASVVGARLAPLAGVVLGVVFGVMPLVYVRFKQARRQRAFTDQLPNVLTLLVGSLRAGHGLSQALEPLVEEVQPPAKTEFGRVKRAVSLGTPIQTALRDMADRVGSDDLDLVVVAITAQYEMGGNLAETLETISETVRDRINLLREVRVLTAQQRFTGFVLAFLPVAAGLLIFLVNPSYMSGLFEPGWVRLLPAAAIVAQVIGFLIMRRITDIEV